MHSPLEIARNFVEIGIHKVKLSAWKMLILGFFAGMFIGFAGIASTTASATIASASVARLVSACVFPAGMAMVLVAGSELFTGNNLIIISVLQKKATVAGMLKNWFFVFLGNFIGAGFVAVMVVYSHVPDLYNGLLAQKVVAAAMSRINQSFSEAFMRGVLCNILVCIAVLMATAARDIAGKVWAIFFPICAFVVGGWEHCVANMFYIPAGIIAATNDTYVAKAEELYGITAAQISASVNVGGFISNLIPVTIGNILGGMVFVALPLYVIHKKKA